MSDEFYKIGDIFEILGERCKVYERLNFDAHDYVGVQNLKTGEFMYLMEAKTNFGMKYFYETNAFFEKRLSYGINNYMKTEPEFVRETKKFLVIGKTNRRKRDNYIFCVEYSIAKLIAGLKDGEEYYGVPVHIFYNDMRVKRYDTKHFTYRIKLIRFAISLKESVTNRIKKAYQESQKFTE